MRAGFDSGVQWQAPVRDPRTLYSPQQIQAVVYRERSRTDRNRSGFSLVVFQIHGDSPQSQADLAHVLLNRARMTDDVGWFDTDKLCTVLPDTLASGARCFAESVCSLALQRSVQVSSRVYTYPLDWFDQERDSGFRRQTPEFPTRPDSQSDGLSSVDAYRFSPPPGEANPENVFHAMRQDVHPLEPLLTRRLPWWKRALDIIGAVMGLVVFSPVMLAVAIAIKLTSPGPVLFKQLRLGLGGKPFIIYKFRTMVVGAEQQQAQLRPFSEQDGPAFKIRNDPRMTPLGRFLRKTTLDEWPQFWNVLKGDASLVGPRPLPVAEANACVCWHRQRLEVTPGLTCIWQVRGRSMVPFNEWMRMDMRYIRKQSLLTDVKIILATIPAVLFQRGAH